MGGVIHTGSVQTTAWCWSHGIPASLLCADCAVAQCLPATPYMLPLGSSCINLQCAAAGSTACGTGVCGPTQVCTASQTCCAAGYVSCAGQCCGGTNTCLQNQFCVASGEMYYSAVYCCAGLSWLLQYSMLQMARYRKAACMLSDHQSSREAQHANPEQQLLRQHR